MNNPFSFQIFYLFFPKSKSQILNLKSFGYFCGNFNTDAHFDYLFYCIRAYRVFSE